MRAALCINWFGCRARNMGDGLRSWALSHGRPAARNNSARLAGRRPSRHAQPGPAVRSSPRTSRQTPGTDVRSADPLPEPDLRLWLHAERAVDCVNERSDLAHTHVLGRAGQHDLHTADGVVEAVLAEHLPVHNHGCLPAAWQLEEAVCLRLGRVSLEVLDLLLKGRAAESNKLRPEHADDVKETRALDRRILRAEEGLVDRRGHFRMLLQTVERGECGHGGGQVLTGGRKSVFGASIVDEGVGQLRELPTVVRAGLHVGPAELAQTFPDRRRSERFQQCGVKVNSLLHADRPFTLRRASQHALQPIDQLLGFLRQRRVVHMRLHNLPSEAQARFVVLEAIPRQHLA
mmetsp:Transcript_30289/g.87319  ORF Transcript_30289/g.87319 Transcript_30289/m.87319 type:complete len:347 (+) Transcript_30289:12-1052(+)